MAWPTKTVENQNFAEPAKTLLAIVSDCHHGVDIDCVVIVKSSILSSLICCELTNF